MKIINKSELTEEKREALRNDKYLDEYISRRYLSAWAEEAPEKIKQWIEKTQDDKQKKGLFIYGKCGTGKTYILYGIIKNFILNDFRPYKLWNSTELSSVFRSESISKDEYERNQTLEDLISSPKFLVIDDFCAEKYSEFLEESFYRIINFYWEKMLPIIITSNYSLKEISDRIGDRIASRIAGMCEVIELTGEDQRIK